MTISVTPAKIHWNYFLALEKDLETASRYIEFSEQNFSVYSIELARLLFAAASEVDVVAKLLCTTIDPSSSPNNIIDYRAILMPIIADLPDMEVFVPRYGLSFRPWIKWARAENPDWWRSYNKVKHERDAYFTEATLKNALYSLGGLLILTYHFYSRKLASQPNQVLYPKDTTGQLQPEPSLLRLHEDYYYDHLVA